MARPSKKTPEQELQIVLAVLRGELTPIEFEAIIGQTHLAQAA